MGRGVKFYGLTQMEMFSPPPLQYRYLYPRGICRRTAPPREKAHWIRLTVDYGEPLGYNQNCLNAVPGETRVIRPGWCRDRIHSCEVSRRTWRLRIETCGASVCAFLVSHTSHKTLPYSDAGGFLLTFATYYALLCITTRRKIWLSLYRAGSDSRERRSRVA